jgi:hypothetical protein
LELAELELLGKEIMPVVAPPAVVVVVLEQHQRLKTGLLV